jgi:hypothetical protein
MEVGPQISEVDALQLSVLPEERDADAERGFSRRELEPYGVMALEADFGTIRGGELRREASLAAAEYSRNRASSSSSSSIQSSSITSGSVPNISNRFRIRSDSLRRPSRRLSAEAYRDRAGSACRRGRDAVRSV